MAARRDDLNGLGEQQLEASRRDQKEMSCKMTAAAPQLPSRCHIVGRRHSREPAANLNLKVEVEQTGRRSISITLEVSPSGRPESHTHTQIWPPRQQQRRPPRGARTVGRPEVRVTSNIRLLPAARDIRAGGGGRRGPPRRRLGCSQTSRPREEATRRQKNSLARWTN